METSSSVIAALQQPHTAADQQRVAAVQTSGLLHRASPQLQAIVERARRIMNTEAAAITVITASHQHILVGAGIDAQVMPREHSVCTHVVASGQPLMITDMIRDPFFSAHPLVGVSDALRAYCGVPITTADGYAAGALCVIDGRERSFSTEQLHALSDLSQDARAILVPGASAQQTLPPAQWLREDPLASWIERTVPDEERLVQLAQRRRRAPRWLQAA